MKTNHATKIRKVFELRSFVSCYFFEFAEMGVSHIPACKGSEKNLNGKRPSSPSFKKIWNPLLFAEETNNKKEPYGAV